MSKFVASVIAGVIATVLGGLVLNYLSSPGGQQTPSPIAAPSPKAPVDDWVVPPEPHNLLIQGHLTRREAAQNCEKGALGRIDKFEHGPSAGRYFCY